MLAAGERVRRALAMTVASIGALAGLAAGAVVAPPSATAAPGPLEGTSVGAVDPVLEADDDLVVEVEVAAAASADREVSVLLSPRPVATRSEFTRWLADGLGPGVLPVAEGTIAAGSTSARIELSSDDVPIPAGFTGAFALAAEVEGDDERARSFVTVDLADGGPTALALSMPALAPEAGPSGLLDADALEATTASGGALDAQRALAERGVALGIDPIVPTSIAALGDDAPESARAWMDAVGALPETFAVPYAGGDPVAIARSGADVPAVGPIPGPDGTLLPPALAQVPSSIAPVVDATDAEVDAGVLEALGDATVVVDTDDLGEELGPRTPGAHVTIDGRSVLAADAELQELVRAATAEGTPTRDGVARVMALLATITREAPSLERVLVAALPADLDPEAAAALVDAIDDAGWTEEADVATALAEQARAATLASAEPADDAAAERVRQAMELGDRPEALRSALADPDVVLAPLRLQLLAAVGAASRPDGDGALAALQVAVAPFATPATVLDGSDALIVSSTADLPVTIDNRLDADLTLRLVAETGTAALVLSEEPIEVELPADERVRVAIPAEVVAPGEGVVRILVTTPDGVEVDRATLRVATQPAVETILLVAMGSAAVLLLGFGIWRSIRKRRRGETEGDMDAAAERVDEAGPEADGGRERS